MLVVVVIAVVVVVVVVVVVATLLAGWWLAGGLQSDVIVMVVRLTSLTIYNARKKDHPTAVEKKQAFANSLLKSIVASTTWKNREERTAYLEHLCSTLPASKALRHDVRTLFEMSLRVMGYANWKEARQKEGLSGLPVRAAAQD